MASEAGRAAHAARVIEALGDRTPGDSDGQALEAINQPPGYRVRPAQAADAPAPPLLTEKGADTPRLRQEVLRLALLASGAPGCVFLGVFAGEACSFAVELVDELCGGLPPEPRAAWRTIRDALRPTEAA